MTASRGQPDAGAAGTVAVGLPVAGGTPERRTSGDGGAEATAGRQMGHFQAARHANIGRTMTETSQAPGHPAVVDRDSWQAEIDALRVREKAHTRAGDLIAAARRRLPMVEVDAGAMLTGPEGPVALRDVFEGRRQLIAYYHMWYPGQPAAEQCEGCTLYNGQVRELSYLHSRDVTYATFCQGPYEESVRYRDFMGWEVPWYSVVEAGELLLAGRVFNRFYLVFYLRQGERVFETYWTNGRGVEVMGPGYPLLLDRTVYGRQEGWEDSPPGWPQGFMVQGGENNPYRTNGRPIAQWPRLDAGRSDDLGSAGRR
jgi:predicted dithiol-disulfide oxidoreductase (DUF899 family)